MKKMYAISGIVFLSIGLILIFGFGSMGQNAEAPETIIVKMYESNVVKNSTLYIYYGDNKVEKIEISKERKTGVEVDQVVTTLNKLNKEGYEITSYAEYSPVEGGILSTFILKKKK